MTLTTVLHPTDFSASAGQALRLAVDLAVRFDAKLCIFHAETLHGDDPSQEADALERYVETAHSLLDGRGTGHRSRVSVTQERSMSAFDGIMRAAVARHTDLIAMGTHGRTGLGKLLMGSTAEKVLRHAACSVLTVKADARLPKDGGFHKLLVPVDFSDGAGRALSMARELRAEDAAIYLLHVVEPVPPMYYAGNLTSRFDLDAELRDRLESTLQDWSGDLPAARRLIAEGNPAVETTRVAEDIGADLLVISTRGLTGLEHLLVGSVTERVCRMATVPVLAVR